MVKKQRSNKSMILLELLFYAALPYAIWNFGREPFGDYVAMLLSTVPGFVYTIYRFILDKQFNITGFFILGSLALGTLTSDSGAGKCRTGKLAPIFGWFNIAWCCSAIIIANKLLHVNSF